MANYRKSFNFRNGVQVDNDNFIVDANGLVGIGTSVPSEFLDVRVQRAPGLVDVRQQRHLFPHEFHRVFDGLPVRRNEHFFLPKRVRGLRGWHHVLRADFSGVGLATFAATPGPPSGKGLRLVTLLVLV